uniref:Selenoprotein O n=1 Tax=Chrysotila carterae TaxID=13221 RepID=A0A7S4BAV8_CHRCT
MPTSRRFGHSQAVFLHLLVDTSLPLPQQCVQLVREFAKRQASLAVNWLRVGYVQGNMNSDNCLLSGRTMDYGPFGFVEEYEALWSPFTSDMERKFGFERQPVAAQVNVLTFAQSLVPLIDGEEGGDEALAEMQKIVKDEYKEIVEAKLGEMRRAKLGIHEWDEQAKSELWPKLQSLMQRSKVDYTILFRQLSSMTKHELSMGFDNLFSRLDPAFYCAETQRELASEWRSWFELYSQRVLSDTRDDETRRDEMRKTSPKYIPREWMLVGAYEAAERGDYGKIEELALIFETPFDEHPEFESKYYCRTPEEFRKKAGVSFFS